MDGLHITTELAGGWRAVGPPSAIGWPSAATDQSTGRFSGLVARPLEAWAPRAYAGPRHLHVRRMSPLALHPSQQHRRKAHASQSHGLFGGGVVLDAVEEGAPGSHQSQSDRAGSDSGQQSFQHGEADKAAQRLMRLAGLRRPQPTARRRVPDAASAPPGKPTIRRAVPDLLLFNAGSGAAHLYKTRSPNLFAGLLGQMTGIGLLRRPTREDGSVRQVPDMQSNSVLSAGLRSVLGTGTLASRLSGVSRVVRFLGGVGALGRHIWVGRPLNLMRGPRLVL
jgi:hypothetical protein